MNFMKTFGLLLAFLLTAMTADAAAVLVVAGNLTDVDGKPVTDTFTVRVTNENQNLEAENRSNFKGEYAVTFAANPPEQTIVAETGDKLRISVLNSDAKLVGSATYQLIDADIAAARAVANVAVDEPAPPIAVLVVAGVVKDDKSNPVGAGISVKVTNEDRQLTATVTTNADGEYVATLATLNTDAELVSAAVGETITVTAESLTERRQLTADDVRAAHLSVDLVTGITNEPPKFTEVGEQAANPAVRLQFSANEGETLQLTLNAEDADGDTLTYTAVSSPTDATLSGNILTWKPEFDAVTRTEGQKNFDVTLTVSDGKVEASQPIRIQVSHVSNASTVTVAAETPELAAIPNSTTKITVTVEDGGTQPVIDELLTLTLEPANAGSLSVVTNQGDGDYTAIYTADTKLGEVKITARTTNAKIGSVSIKLVMGPPEKLELTVDPFSLVAGSGKKAAIIVRVTDAANHPITDANSQFSINPANAGNLSAVTNQNDGNYTTTYTAGQNEGSVTLTVTVDALTEQQTITLTPKPINPPAIIEMDEPQRNVERGQKITLQIRVFDKDRQPISGANVTVTTDIGTVDATATSKGSGIYTAAFSYDLPIKANEPAKATLIARVVDTSLSLTKTITIDDTVAILTDGSITPQKGKAGDTFNVTATGESDATVTFTIGGVASAQSLPMTEENPGEYAATYQIPTTDTEEFDVSNVKDQLQSKAVAVQLKDLAGNTANLTLTEQIIIDNVPPPAPKKLAVLGGEITTANEAKVMVTAIATENRTVEFSVTAVKDGANMGLFSIDADANGNVTWDVNASSWLDGDYLFEAKEAPDAVGNEGLVASVPVTKDTRPPGKARILAPDFAPKSPIPYNTTVELKVTIVFFEDPPKGQVELEITLSPPIGDDKNFFLPVEPIDPRDLKEQSGTLTFLADELGSPPWKYTIVWQGKLGDRPVERDGSFEVVKDMPTLNFGSDLSFITIGQTIPFRGQLAKPKQANEQLELQVLRPTRGAWEQVTDVKLTTGQDGHFVGNFTPSSTDKLGVWQFRVVWDGNEGFERIVSPSAEVAVQFPLGKAIIGVGGSPSQRDWQKTFLRLGQQVRSVFQSRGFPDPRIRFLSPDLTAKPTDTPMTIDTLRDAIINWGPEDLLPNENLYIYLLSDNLRKTGFILRSGVFGVERLETSDLNDWLDQLTERGINVVLIIEACFSGEFIQKSEVYTQALIKGETPPRRVVITSAKADQQAYVIRTDSFTRRFFNRLHRGEDFKEAFDNTENDMELGRFRNAPLVDSDGDGTPNEDNNSHLLANLYIGDPETIILDPPPEIEDWTSPIVLAAGVKEVEIEAFIRHAGNEFSTTTFIIPPGQKALTTVFDSWDDLEQEGETIELTGSENEGFRATYDKFTKPGVYTIMIYAENIDGNAIPAITTVTVPLPAWDVNRDGVVNIFDLVIVGGQFGKTPLEEAAADVTGDGTVNIFDLVTVASHFGETTNVSAAPSHQQAIAAIQQALTELEGSKDKSHGVQIAIASLQQWLLSQRPPVTETKLMQNFPNPFNPETWMPYQLAIDADVHIAIYDIRGSIVRRLNIGFQPAGVYTAHAKAAYWDGRSGLGQKVSSGVYFYQITAGDYSSVRRMVIVK